MGKNRSLAGIWDWSEAGFRIFGESSKKSEWFWPQKRNDEYNSIGNIGFMRDLELGNKWILESTHQGEISIDFGEWNYTLTLSWHIDFILSKYLE